MCVDVLGYECLGIQVSYLSGLRQITGDLDSLKGVSWCLGIQVLYLGGVRHLIGDLD